MNESNLHLRFWEPIDDYVDFMLRHPMVWATEDPFDLDNFYE